MVPLAAGAGESAGEPGVHGLGQRRVRLALRARQRRGVNHGIGLLALQEVFDRAWLRELHGDGAELRRWGGVSVDRHHLVTGLDHMAEHRTPDET